MKIMQNYLDSHTLSRTEVVKLSQNYPLWRLLALDQWHNVLVVVQAKRDYDNII